MKSMKGGKAGDVKLQDDEWMMNIEVDDMEDSIEKVAELLKERKI